MNRQAKLLRSNKDFPIAAIAYYGPDDRTATKTVVAIIDGNQNILESENWTVNEGDIRFNQEINHRIASFISARTVKKVVIAEGILGCPHTMGVDYPADEDCPYCPYWSDVEQKE